MKKQVVNLDVIRLRCQKKKGRELLLFLYGPIPHVAARPFSGEPLGGSESVSALEVLQELGAAEHVHAAREIDGDVRHSSTS